MVGEQAINKAIKLIVPRIYKYCNSIALTRRRSLGHPFGPRWLSDLTLIEWDSQSLFREYLEMVMQYGFVTIFVAAFPLVPFFALLNNILEMRFDAKKLLKKVGVWYRILDSIIAFTSEFIPRLVYQFHESPNGSLHGYVNHSLSHLNSSHFAEQETPKNASQHEICRYSDFRSDPGTEHEYEKAHYFWTVLAVRHGFVLVFEMSFRWPLTFNFFLFSLNLEI